MSWEKRQVWLKEEGGQTLVTACALFPLSVGLAAVWFYPSERRGPCWVKFLEWKSLTILLK